MGRELARGHVEPEEDVCAGGRCSALKVGGEDSEEDHEPFFGLQLRSHLLLFWGTAPCTLSSETRVIAPLRPTLATSVIPRDSWDTLAARGFLAMIWVQGDLTSSSQGSYHFISCSDMLSL